MDITPPVLDFYFYMDVALTGLYEQAPVNYQASNSTIEVLWRFLDEESEIEVCFKFDAYVNQVSVVSF